jgi:hypothetical protein
MTQMGRAYHLHRAALTRLAALVLLILLALHVEILRAASAIPTCTELAARMPSSAEVKSVRSAIVPATDSDVGYCRVDLRYGRKPQQNINIAVTLPLSAADGGTGGIEGAWNGRTQGLGGAGCTGNLLAPPSPAQQTAVKAGYVVSGNDLGHSGSDCEPGVSADGSYNLPFIQDFIRDGVKQQILWSKTLTHRYYGRQPKYNYWNGCSTGGRQGYLLAQELGDQLEGILADAPAIYWSRFQTAQMWGQIVMRQLAGGPISSAKLQQVRQSAVQACDAADGVADGIIQDPRACGFSARANICGASTAPPTNCLTADEAAAIDKIWDGPRNSQQVSIWYGLDRGTDFAGLDGARPFTLGVTQFHWDTHDRDLDWQSVSADAYAGVAQQGSRNLGRVTDTDKPLDAFRAHGGKLLTFVGSNDQLIFPRGVIGYYREMAARYGRAGEPEFSSIQQFYRLFLAPGVGHCGGGAGPAPVDPFDALVKWVEQGVVPATLLASGGSAAPATGRTRPLCPYPSQGIYNGSGSIDDAANFHCGGNLEQPSLVCADVPARYQHEKDGERDFRAVGLSAKVCRGAVN